jgi:hypothetical protein
MILCIFSVIVCTNKVHIYTDGYAMLRYDDEGRASGHPRHPFKGLCDITTSQPLTTSRPRSERGVEELSSAGTVPDI